MHTIVVAKCPATLWMCFWKSARALTWMPPTVLTFNCGVNLPRVPRCLVRIFVSSVFCLIIVILFWLPRFRCFSLFQFLSLNFSFSLFSPLNPFCICSWLVFLFGECCVCGLEECSGSSGWYAVDCPRWCFRPLRPARCLCAGTCFCFCLCFCLCVFECHSQPRVCCLDSFHSFICIHL